MNRTITLALFGVLVLAQLAVPVTMIVGREQVLAGGTVYKFRTIPIDPYDAFRGKYVTLRFQSNEVTPRSGVAFQQNDTAYALLTTDTSGFATFYDLISSPPAQGEYLRVQVDRLRGSAVQLRLPFDRYYMPEDLAPQAERAVAQGSRQRDAYVTVRILNGTATLEDLYVGGLTIREFLQQNAN